MASKRNELQVRSRGGILMTNVLISGCLVVGGPLLSVV